MKRTLKKIFDQQLSKGGMVISKITPKEKITDLIESLYPYQTQNNLIRIGPDGDGGYLVPDDLKGIKACFSPGVDILSEFELKCLEDYGMKIFMADKSVDKPNLDIPDSEFDFLKKFIGSINNEDFITMDSWVDSSLQSNDSELLLQMDIEGAEYNSIINMSDSLMSRFRIMIFEFHYLDCLWQQHFFNLAEAAFSKILQTHICVHIHPNNCYSIDSLHGVEIPRIAEFTFIRKDRVELENYQTQFPHKLDFDNSKNKHIALPKNWYKSEKQLV